MPTPLQIDIPQEQADRIIEKKRELGPYVFREAQVSFNKIRQPDRDSEKGQWQIAQW